jgi:hypothetical protein
MANNTGTFFNINDNDGIPLVGVSTDGKVMINHLYGNCLIGSTSVTGNASQPLQVTGGAYVSGNLGIGSTNPTAKLSVVGGAYVSGNLGIGSTNPTAKLSVVGDGNFTGVVTATTFNGQINAGVSTISVNSSTDALRITQTGSGNALVVEDETNPDATPFVINQNGYVGINTNTPSSGYKLQVHDSFIQITNAVEGTGIIRGLVIGYDSSLNSQIINSFAKPLVLNTSAAGTPLVLQSIAARRVGIGSTLPNNKLDVIGDTYISGNLGIGTTNPQYNLDVLGNGRFTKVITPEINSGGANYVLFEGSGIRVESDSTFDGSVGIGTLTPTDPLDVNGNIRVRSGLKDIYGNVGAAGSILVSTGAGVSWTTPVVISRNTISGTTPILSSGSSANITFNGFKSYLLLKIQTSGASWITLYTDTTSRTNDSSRTELTDPLSGSGVIAEIITTGAAIQLITPGTIGYNNDDPVTTNIYAKVVNKSVSSTAITVTLTLVKMEG